MVTVIIPVTGLYNALVAVCVVVALLNPCPAPRVKTKLPLTPV